ncbi:unnamed protein product (mitochondrion) [Plasmodiophora brassicae]|uniref:Protein kish n=1 Tax=Plasmodiophora brassicae TaxID=37360 RepID=A0A3P3Y9S8_PLABS|nr:unnamed protein product [Plasmodiophora brassicae]
MSAFFNFQSLLCVILLAICTCAYLHARWPALLDAHKNGFRGLFWKFARIGERLSPLISISCIAMGFSTIFLES